MPKSTEKPAVKAVKKAAPKSKSTAKPTTKKVAAKKPAAPRAKATAPAAVLRPALSAKKPTVTVSPVTSDAIALKAYYLGERRRHLGIPGDPQADWLEAERLLRGA